MENEEKVTLWTRAAIAGGWLRDQFAALFASFWLYIILWAVVLGAFTVLLYIDGIFSRSLAPDSINPLSFQAMGWAYRLFAASFLMAAARCKLKGLKGGTTFRALGAFASVIVCLHAFGFGFEALDDRRDQALTVREVGQIAQSNTDDQIAVLERRKAGIDTDLDAAVTALNAEITQYISDGLNNDDLADDSRARRTRLQDQAALDKREIDDQILQLVAGGAAARTDAVEKEADAEAWAPLFIGMAQLFTWTKEPTDWAIYLSAIGFVIFWVLLGESLVIFLPERIYVMHMHDAEHARGGRAIYTQDEMLHKARQVAAGWKGAETKAREARRNGVEKIIQAGSDLDPAQEEYWKEHTEKALAKLERQPRRATSVIAEKDFGGRTQHELGNHLRRAVGKGWIEQSAYDKIMKVPAVMNGSAVETKGQDDEYDTGISQPDQDS